MSAYSDLLILGAYAVVVTVVGGVLAHRSQRVSKQNADAARRGLPPVKERRGPTQAVREERREMAGHRVAG